MSELGAQAVLTRSIAEEVDLRTHMVACAEVVEDVGMEHPIIGANGVSELLTVLGPVAPLLAFMALALRLGVLATGTTFERGVLGTREALACLGRSVLRGEEFLEAFGPLVRISLSFLASDSN